MSVKIKFEIPPCRLCTNAQGMFSTGGTTDGVAYTPFFSPDCVRVWLASPFRSLAVWHTGDNSCKATFHLVYQELSRGCSSREIRQTQYCPCGWENVNTWNKQKVFLCCICHNRSKQWIELNVLLMFIILSFIRNTLSVWRCLFSWLDVAYYNLYHSLSSFTLTQSLSST